MYPGDWVGFSTELVATQYSGVTGGSYNGTVLANTDYFAVNLADHTGTNSGAGCQLGVFTSTTQMDMPHAITLGSDDTLSVTAGLAAVEDLVYIQSWGVTTLARCDADGNRNDQLQLSTTAGMCATAVSAATIDEGELCGIELADAQSMQRAAAADSDGCYAFVRCNF
jgi:hypothetical protein